MTDTKHPEAPPLFGTLGDLAAWHTQAGDILTDLINGHGFVAATPRSQYVAHVLAGDLQDVGRRLADMHAASRQEQHTSVWRLVWDWIRGSGEG